MTIEQLVEMLKNVKFVCDSVVRDRQCQCYVEGYLYHHCTCYVPYFQDIAKALEGLDEQD